MRDLGGFGLESVRLQSLCSYPVIPCLPDEGQYIIWAGLDQSLYLGHWAGLSEMGTQEHSSNSGGTLEGVQWVEKTRSFALEEPLRLKWGTGPRSRPRALAGSRSKCRLDSCLKEL